jgi:hypothetical protein
MKKVRGGNRGGNPSASDILGKRSEYTDLSGGHAPTDKEIQLRAYWIHLDRGGQHGYHLDDWLQAERELAEGRSADPPTGVNAQ